MTHGHAASRPTIRGPLAGTRFLAAFRNPEERFALDAVAQPARAYRGGIDLVREGDAIDRLFVLTEGWACRYKTSRDGHRQIVALVVPGDIANLDTLLFGRSDFGVRALTPLKAVTLACDEVLTLADTHAGIGKTLTRLALNENAILSQWALCLGCLSARERLAHLFCELSERLHPERVEDGVSFELPLTQELIADTLGLTSVHVNRTLQQLRTDGLVETSSRTVSLPDVPRLRALAGFDAHYLRGERADRLAANPVQD